MYKFKFGDRVMRPVIIGELLYRRGKVVEVYRGVPSGVSPGVILYGVRWEDGIIERGYLEAGLEREPLSLGGLGV